MRSPDGLASMDPNSNKEKAISRRLSRYRRFRCRWEAMPREVVAQARGWGIGGSEELSE
jgi:hypothetical protein